MTNPPAYTPHTRTRVTYDTDVYTLALERTAYILDNTDQAIVMFSGGKDSTATLQIALEVARSDPRYERHLPMRVVHYDEEAIPYETEDYVRRVSRRDDVDLTWYCLPVKHRNACSRRHPYWWPWAPEDEHKWCRPLPPEAVTHLHGFTQWPQEARLTIPDMMGLLAPGRAKTTLLMGIRAQESITRHRAVTAKTVDNYIIDNVDCHTCHGNVAKAYPVYDWKTEDIWTAPARHGWDYNRAYDHLEMAGLSPSLQRCSPAFGEEPLQKLHTYAACFPDVWARMVERVPGVGAAYRYALTELYAYRDRPTKPAGLPWPDFIANYVAKFGPDEQAHIADRITQTIKRHYRYTTHPIAPRAPHPNTGVSWDFLLTIAMRGDLKNRKQEATKLGAGKEPKLWAEYTTDLANAIADGATPAELGHPRPLPADPTALIPPEYR